MATFYDNFHKEIKIFDKKRKPKNLRLGLHYGFLSYFLTKDETILNDLKRLVFVANKEYTYSEEPKIALALLEILDKKTPDLDFFSNNKSFYKNCYKSLKNKYYLYYLFFKIQLEDKNVERLQEELSKYALTDNLACLFLGIIYYYKKDYGSMYDTLSNAYIKGCNSPYFYLLLREYFLKSDGIDKHKLFGKYVKWSLNHKVELVSTISIYYGKESYLDFGDFDLLCRLYNVTQNVEVLKCVINRAMENPKIGYTKEAYKIYLEAYRKQIFIENFEPFLLKAMSNLQFKDISIQTITSFLNMSNLDVQDLSYLYSLIVTYEKYEKFIEEYQDEIFNFAYNGLKKGEKDNAYLNIYKYILLNQNSKIDSQEVSILENLLVENLFKYRLEFFGDDSKKVRVVWLKNHHFEEGDTFFTKEGYAIVYSIDNEPDILFFDYGKKNILDISYELKPVLEGDNSNLYKYFYEKGVKSDFLVLSVALSYLDAKKYDLEIFEDVLKIKISSKYENIFKNILGIHYFKDNNLEHSLKYFDEIEIVNNDLGKLLIDTQMENKEYNKVCELILKFANDIDRDSLLETVDILVTEDIKTDISHLCYELMCQGFFTKNSLEYIVNNYKGTMGEYKLIYKNVKETEFKGAFTESILKTYINKRLLSSSKKEVNFLVTILKEYDNYSMIKHFCEYLTLEVLVNDFIITKELLFLLEDFYEKYNLKFFAVPLAKTYLYNKTDKQKAIIEKAIEICKENNIVFSFFRELSECNTVDFVNNYHSVIFIVNKNEQLFIKVKGSIKAMETIGLGIYYYTTSCFYGETITYGIFNKNNELLEEKSYKNQNKHISLKDDLFGKINNALIYESDHKYNLLEKEIEWLIDEEQENYLII